MKQFTHMHCLASVLFITCMTGLTGCGTYRVTNSGGMATDKAIRRLDKMAKASSKREYWSEKTFAFVGADKTGIKYIGDIKKYVAVTYYQWQGKPYNRRYEDIVDVEVSWHLKGLFWCGIFDPTAYSKIKITSKNGATDEFVVPNNQRLFPFYLFEPALLRTHRAGQAIVTMKE